MSDLDPSELWDAWTSARERDPALTLEAFCASRGPDCALLLTTMLRVQTEAPPSPLIDLLAPGNALRSFAGHELVRTLGQGGSGLVFLARRAVDGREVALKVLNPLLASVPERRNSILREAAIAQRLQHPGIVGVLDSGVERGHAWISTEYCDGVAVDAWVADSSSPAERIERTLRVGRRIAEALGHAHANDVIHRDIKPQNVLVDAHGDAHVLDFGLARADGTAFAISRTGDMVGTPLYMAPEQARSDDAAVGSWTDVHALGLLLWELASGRRLALEDNAWRAFHRVASGHRRISPEQLRLVPSGLRTVVARCIEPAPEDRYADGTAVAEDLARVAAGQSPLLSELNPIARSLRRMRRHPLRTGLTFGAAAAVVVIAWFAWWTWPMRVHFDEERGGKTVWIDGVEHGTTPLDIWLRPGEHTWRASYPGVVDEVYAGAFRVEPRTPSVQKWILDAPNGCPILPPVLPIEPDRWAWVQVSTPELEIALDIDGHRIESAPGIAATRLPFGTHTLRATAAGKRAVEWTLIVHEQRLHSCSFEFDDEGSPWHTLLVYSPIEEIVRASSPRESGARLYYENQRIATRGLYVDRAYLGPSESRQTAELVVRIDLPVVPAAMEIEILCSSLASGVGAWSRVEAGWREDRLVTLHESRPGSIVPEERIRVDPASWANFELVEASALDRLLQDPTRSKTLIVRCSAGGVPAGGNDSAHAQVLRAEALPARMPTGELLWSPSIRLRTR